MGWIVVMYGAECEWGNGNVPAAEEYLHSALSVVECIVSLHSCRELTGIVKGVAIN